MQPALPLLPQPRDLGLRLRPALDGGQAVRPRLALPQLLGQKGRHHGQRRRAPAPAALPDRVFPPGPPEKGPHRPRHGRRTLPPQRPGLPGRLRPADAVHQPGDPGPEGDRPRKAPPAHRQIEREHPRHGPACGGTGRAPLDPARPVPGLTDDEDGLRRTGAFIAILPTVQRVEVLPYHTLGLFKWQKLGIPYSLAGAVPPTDEQVRRAEELLIVDRYSG